MKATKSEQKLLKQTFSNIWKLTKILGNVKIIYSKIWLNLSKNSELFLHFNLPYFYIPFPSSVIDLKTDSITLRLAVKNSTLMGITGLELSKILIHRELLLFNLFGSSFKTLFSELVFIQPGSEFTLHEHP